MDKILCICPKYPPLMDGLSGHTKYLTDELSKSYEIDLLTSISIPSKQKSTINILSRVKKWKFFELKKHYLDINTTYKHIIVQYVPSLFASRGGINFSVIFFFLYLKFWKKESISIIFHELYFPMQANYKAIILHLCHKLMLFGAVNSASFCFFSTSYYRKIGKRFSFSRQKCFHLPVGASIEIDDQNQGKDSKKTTYVIFGGYHPSKRYDLVFEAFANAYKSNKDFELIIIGATKEALEKELKVPEDIDSYSVFKGKLSDNEVISEFKRADFLISYFSDGLTTRRSSAISALANNLAIISSQSSNTDKILLDCPAIILFSNDESHFKSSLLEFILNPKFTPKDAPKNFYKKTLSWELIINKLVSSWNQQDQS